MSIKADSALIQECISGNTRSFEQLVERYKKPIFNIAYRISNNRDDASEIVQATFIKAFEHLHTFNIGRKFFSWLYRIATNEALNHVRGQKTVESLDENFVSRDHTPHSQLEASEQDEGIQRAIMRLTPEHRIVIVLCHFHNLSYAEIGTILDIPVKTVKSRLFSARKTLRELLED